NAAASSSLPLTADVLANACMVADKLFCAKICKGNKNSSQNFLICVYLKTADSVTALSAVIEL
ncbi:hypothetical protein ABTE00_22335, partial [Acinetobacter baumannii]